MLFSRQHLQLAVMNPATASILRLNTVPIWGNHYDQHLGLSRERGDRGCTSKGRRSERGFGIFDTTFRLAPQNRHAPLKVLNCRIGSPVGSGRGIAGTGKRTNLGLQMVEFLSFL